MLKIEVFKEDAVLTERIIKPRDDKPGKTFYEQVAYAYLGGKFPVQIKLPMEKGQEPYAAGLYTPHSSSYVVNNFGGLELKRFGQLIQPLESEL
ncbi:single-stranded DNA-binding protein [Aliivibrio finisterrensis]|uniref:single-stranded DNA-binding protein n=1 Tax=Aliivibrio finisterrensis TaxID=511998 RepID=UPI00101E9C8E|nr:single-stranded DNA-binding protein [Aliivibrio finisterrensis]RYU80347.1 hypothetical protein ERW55_16610 [Aliivibrio finisterrensis]